MDLNSLMGTLLSSDVVSNLSQATGAPAAGVQSVLASVLPQLLSGAQAQASNAATAESFLGALTQHGKDNTADLTSFLQNIDQKDGEKIVSHLLGAQQAAATQAAAERAGLSAGNTSRILSMAAPLLMSLLGQQTQAAKQTPSAISALMGSLLGGTDPAGLVSGLLGGSADGKNQKSAAGKADGSELLGGLGNLLGNLLK